MAKEHLVLIRGRDRIGLVKTKNNRFTLPGVGTLDKIRWLKFTTCEKLKLTKFTRLMVKWAKAAI